LRFENPWFPIGYGSGQFFYGKRETSNVKRETRSLAIAGGKAIGDLTKEEAFMPFIVDGRRNHCDKNTLQQKRYYSTFSILLIITQI